MDGPLKDAKRLMERRCLAVALNANKIGKFLKLSMVVGDRKLLQTGLENGTQTQE